MKLYGSETSPYVRKVRMLIHELDLDVGLVPVRVHEIPSDFGRINPVNRIPALEFQDGTFMFDSRVICEYLDQAHGAKHLPPSGDARWQTLKLQVFGDGMMDAATPRVGELARVAEQRSDHRLAEYQRSIEQTLSVLENSVDEFGNLSLGTISIACALGYLDFRLPNEAWRTGRPNLAAWYESMSTRPSMIATAPPA